MRAILNKNIKSKTTSEQLNGNNHVAISYQHGNNSDSEQDNMFLEKLYCLMEVNLDNHNYSLNDLVKALYLNRTHFYKKVKTLTNQTPFVLFKNYRLNRATEILTQNSFSVYEVYLMTGFKSRTHFTKAFKEKYNITPGRYAMETNIKYKAG